MYRYEGRMIYLDLPPINIKLNDHLPFSLDEFPRAVTGNTAQNQEILVPDWPITSHVP